MNVDETINNPIVMAIIFYGFFQLPQIVYSASQQDVLNKANNACMVSRNGKSSILAETEQQQQIIPGN